MRLNEIIHCNMLRIGPDNKHCTSVSCYDDDDDDEFKHFLWLSLSHQLVRLSDVPTGVHRYTQNGEPCPCHSLQMQGSFHVMKHSRTLY